MPQQEVSQQPSAAAAGSLLPLPPLCWALARSAFCLALLKLVAPHLGQPGTPEAAQTGAGHGHSWLLPDAGTWLPGLCGGSCSRQSLGELLCCLTGSGSHSTALEGPPFLLEILPGCACLPEHTSASLLPTASLRYALCYRDGMRCESGQRAMVEQGLISFSSPAVTGVHGAHPAFLLWNLPRGSLAMSFCSRAGSNPLELQTRCTPLCAFPCLPRKRIVEDAPCETSEGL